MVENFCPTLKIFIRLYSYVYIAIRTYTADCKYQYGYRGGLFMDGFGILKQLMTNSYDPMMHAYSSVVSYYFSLFAMHRLFTVSY